MATDLEKIRMEPDDLVDFKLRLIRVAYTGARTNLDEVSHNGYNDSLRIAQIRNELKALGAVFGPSVEGPDKLHKRTKIELNVLGTLLVGEEDEVRSEMNWGGSLEPVFTRFPVERVDSDKGAQSTQLVPGDKSADQHEFSPFVQQRARLLKAVGEAASLGQTSRFAISLKDFGQTSRLDERLEESLDSAIMQILRPPRVIVDSDEIILEDKSIMLRKIITYHVLWNNKPVSIIKIQNFHKANPSVRDVIRLNTNYFVEPSSQLTQRGNNSGNPR